jgi:hypothetical protein
MRYGQYKPKMTDEAAAQRGWRPVKRDTMPAEVATDLLCTLERVTNTARKQYQEVRQRIFGSVLVRKPAEAKLSAKATEATLAQLVKWSRRTAKKRRGLQNKYEKAIRLPEDTTGQQVLKQRLVAGLDLVAARIDRLTDAIQNELDARAGKHGYQNPDGN